MACDRITAAITRALVGRAPDQGAARSLQPDRLHRPRQASTPRRPTAGRPTPAAATSTGSSSTATGRPSSAASPSRTRACRPTSRITISASKCRTATARRRASTCPDFIVLVDDGHGDDDLLHLIVEIKGYRREDAKEKKSTMETYWVPRREQPRPLRPLGVRRVHRGLPDRSRLRGQGRSRIRWDDRVGDCHVGQFRLNRLGKGQCLFATQLGADEKWARLNDAVLAAIRSTPDHAFQLSEFDRCWSKSVSCSADETLSLLALLSGRSAGILKMELRSGSPNGSEISPSEFIRMLTSWWKTKSISEETWRAWASRIYVRWVPASEGALH